MAGDEGLDAVEPLGWRGGVVVVGFDPLMRVGGGGGETDGGVEWSERSCRNFERDGMDDEAGDGVVNGLRWKGAVALGRWMIWPGTSCGAEVDLEGFGQGGSSNDAATDEVAVDVPYLASVSVLRDLYMLEIGNKGLRCSQIPRRHPWQDVYICRPSPQSLL